MSEQNQSTDLTVADGGADSTMLATSDMDSGVQNPDLDEKKQF
ncbi:hypothetical protein QW180_04220 [Vibrio sinaloensis]|nr:hypothetical protein [Vibrio sinaloensis]